MPFTVQDTKCLLIFVDNVFSVYVAVEERCPILYPVNHLLNNCQPLVGNECEYACTEGFQKNMTVQKIKCLPTRGWSHDAFEVCKQFEIQGEFATRS